MPTKKKMILTTGLRNKLKSIVAEEIKQLPNNLKELEPKERINILIKLMPFVFPKVETVSPTEGEPFSFGNLL